MRRLLVYSKEKDEEDEVILGQKEIPKELSQQHELQVVLLETVGLVDLIPEHQLFLHTVVIPHLNMVVQGNLILITAQA